MISSAQPAVSRSRPLLAIFWGGLLCGVLDITSAFVAYYIYRAIPPIRILQSVAAGAIGRTAAFRGGWATALLGLLFHFLIAFTAATIFYLASRRIDFLTRYPWISGALYAEIVYLVMNFVVIPLSATARGPFVWPGLITGPIGHIFFVGLPISLAVRKFTR
jgi:hypothetical protein